MPALPLYRKSRWKFKSWKIIKPEIAVVINSPLSDCWLVNINMKKCRIIIQLFKFVNPGGLLSTVQVGKSTIDVCGDYLKMLVDESFDDNNVDLET